MKNSNNFNQSSNGVNIELSAYCDCDTSRFWFDEAFHVLRHSSHSTNSVLVFGKNLVDVSDFDVNDKDNYNLKKTTVKKLRAFLRNELGYGYRDLMVMIKDELLDELYNYCPEEFADTLTNHLDAVPTFATVESRGYCQGDYSEIIIPANVISEFVGQSIDSIGEHLQEEIDRLLWDAPIYCAIDVDDNERIVLSDLLCDLYDWDKQKAIDVFKLGMDRTLSKAQYKAVVSFLRENLDDNLEYNH